MGAVTLDERLRRQCTEAVAREGERFGLLAQEVEAGLTAAPDLQAPVPWVPAWTIRDLVGHLGAVHRWATAIVRAGTTDRPAAPPQPPDRGLLDWYAAGLTDLVHALRDTPPDAPAWHMSPAAEKTVGSWVRRQAHELAVHRMDLEVAAGLPVTAVDPELAEDGADEVLRVVVPGGRTSSRWPRPRRRSSCAARTPTGSGRSGSAAGTSRCTTPTPTPPTPGSRHRPVSCCGGCGGARPGSR